MLEVMEEMRGLLRPALEFHAEGDDGDSEDDVRFLWEVKAVRGKNRQFARIAGSSSMPGLLSTHQLHMAAEKVGAEMLAKVASPMVAKFQEMVNAAALGMREQDERNNDTRRVSKRDNLPPPVTDAELTDDVDRYSREGRE